MVRTASRFAVSLLVAFSEDQDAVGVIRDLSINGCCISSGTVVKAGESEPQIPIRVMRVG